MLLQLQHVQHPVGVDPHEVNHLPIGRGHLTTDKQQRLTEDRHVRLDQLFEARLQSIGYPGTMASDLPFHSGGGSWPSCRCQ
jgi:hypothetical protein